MNDQRMHRREKIWILAVFFFFVVWFTRIHPLTVYDADDWRYIAYVRTALPLWNDWNPARVFPEVFMPLMSAVAVHILMPVLGDYLQALTVMHGIVVALFIGLYMYCFLQMLRRVFSLSVWGNIYASALFLIFHFLIFRSYDNRNVYLFYCWDLTCYYYYLIPALLNASLVMSMMGRSGEKEYIRSMSVERQGLLAVAVYFAIFSNLPASGILAAYAGSVLLKDLLVQLLHRENWKKFWKDHDLHMGVLVVWLISAVFELSGGRAGADYMGTQVPLLQAIKEAAYAFTRLPSYSNPAFLGTAGILSVLAAVLFVRKKENRQPFAAEAAVSLIGFGAMLVYAVLLCAAVDLSYTRRMEYQFGFLFYLLLLLVLLFAYVLERLPRLYLVIPVLLCVLAGECNTLDKTYLESNQTNLDPQICNQITQDMIDAFLQADAAGESTVDLQLPVWESSDNWPHSVYIGDKITDSLYEHGMISRKIKATPNLTVDKNLEYGLVLPGAGK